MKPAVYINARGEQVMDLAVFKALKFEAVMQAVKLPYPKGGK